ncbi:MAG: phosphatidylserine decarboxylase family protein [Gemmataceae bacterium]|nr:phosphatidylserine decarboxylase family protein [Gemmataceae bacterium]
MSSMVQQALPTTPQTPACVQPGGGWCCALEQAWGRLRRWWLRTLFPGYVRRMEANRQGACPGCPHDIVDPRDLKHLRNVCGYWWRPEDDPFAWRGRLGFARHGLAELLIFTVVLLLLGGVFATLGAMTHYLFWILAAATGIVWLEIVWFFRDPERAIPADADALVSPADGTVTNVEEIDEPGFGRALRISIFLSIFNVHVNRLPRAGRITQVRYFPGAFLDARNPDSAVRNEQLWIDMEEAGTNRPIRVKQISGAIARRIVCWLKAGDLVQQGERLGMIKLGSRTDVLIPAGQARAICVKVGDQVKGGTTILGTLIHTDRH